MILVFCDWEGQGISIEEQQRGIRIRPSHAENQVQANRTAKIIETDLWLQNRRRDVESYKKKKGDQREIVN